MTELDIEALKRLQTTLSGGPPTGAIHAIFDQLPAIIVALERAVVVEEGLESEARHLAELLAESRKEHERLRAAGAVQRKAEHDMLSMVPIGGHGSVESRLVTEWIEAGAKLEAALEDHSG